MISFWIAASVIRLATVIPSTVLVFGFARPKASYLIFLTNGGIFARMTVYRISSKRRWLAPRWQKNKDEESINLHRVQDTLSSGFSFLRTVEKVLPIVPVRVRINGRCTVFVNRWMFDVTLVVLFGPEFAFPPLGSGSGSGRIRNWRESICLAVPVRYLRRILPLFLQHRCFIQRIESINIATWIIVGPRIQFVIIVVNII